jgi:transposase
MVCPNGLALTGPDLNRVARSWCIWVLTRLDGQGTRARWDGYLVDADLRQSVTSLRGKLSLHMTLLDLEGKPITEDEIPLNDAKEKRILWAGLPRGAAVKQRYLIIVNVVSGRSASQTAAALQIHPTTVYRVIERFRRSGEAGLCDGRAANGADKLTEEYLAKLYEVVRGTPDQYGWRRPTWTQDLHANVTRTTAVRTWSA